MQLGAVGRGIARLDRRAVEIQALAQLETVSRELLLLRLTGDVVVETRVIVDDVVEDGVRGLVPLERTEAATVEPPARPSSDGEERLRRRLADEAERVPKAAGDLAVMGRHDEQAAGPERRADAVKKDLSVPVVEDVDDVVRRDDRVVRGSVEDGLVANVALAEVHAGVVPAAVLDHVRRKIDADYGVGDRGQIARQPARAAAQ